MEKFLIAGRKRRQTETSVVAEQRKIERRKKMPETSPSPASSSAHAISARRVDHTKFSFPSDIGKFVGRALSVSDKTISCVVGHLLPRIPFHYCNLVNRVGVLKDSGWMISSG